MFFTTKRDAQSLQEQTGDYINKSGIYDVIIKFASVNRGDKGSISIDFNCEYKGSETTFYGLRLTNNDGSDNFQKPLFNKLLVVLGIDALAEPTPEDHAVGKDRQVKSFAVLTELSDQPIKIRVQYSYSMWQGEIVERREIKNFYRASDGAVASEVESGQNIGVQLNKDRAYENNVTYKDGLTEAMVAEWKAAKKAGTNYTPNTVSKPATTNPFGKVS